MNDLLHDRKSLLRGRTVVFVVAGGFEQSELAEPKRALERVGAETRIVSPEGPEIRAWDRTEWGKKFPVDQSIDDADPNQFDALVLPGGVMNPDRLRRNKAVLRFVRAFFDAKKPVAAICHGLWTLIDARVVGSRRVTSYPSLQTDLKNAGALWLDEEVVIDENLITSRRPEDLPAFNEALIEKMAEVTHAHVG